MFEPPRRRLFTRDGEIPEVAEHLDLEPARDRVNLRAVGRGLDRDRLGQVRGDVEHERADLAGAAARRDQCSSRRSRSRSGPWRGTAPPCRRTPSRSPAAPAAPRSPRRRAASKSGGAEPKGVTKPNASAPSSSSKSPRSSVPVSDLVVLRVRLGDERGAGAVEVEELRVAAVDREEVEAQLALSWRPRRRRSGASGAGARGRRVASRVGLKSEDDASPNAWIRWPTETSSMLSGVVLPPSRVTSVPEPTVTSMSPRA